MAEDVRAEMVSTVYQVVVSEGDVVADGDTLVILESMKMEIPVDMPRGGVLKAILVKEEESVTEGQAVAEIE